MFIDYSQNYKSNYVKDYNTFTLKEIDLSMYSTVDELLNELAKYPIGSWTKIPTNLSNGINNCASLSQEAIKQLHCCGFGCTALCEDGKESVKNIQHSKTWRPYNFCSCISSTIHLISKQPGYSIYDKKCGMLPAIKYFYEKLDNNGRACELFSKIKADNIPECVKNALCQLNGLTGNKVYELTSKGHFIIKSDNGCDIIYKDDCKELTEYVSVNKI